MSGERIITELFIDSSGALTGVTEFEAASNRIVAASERAAASVDRISTTLERVGRVTTAQQGVAETSRAVASGASQTADALTRQEQSANSATVALGQLRAAQTQLIEQRAALSGGVQLGSISSSQIAQLREFDTQLRQVTEAMAALRSGASVAEVMERFPAAFRLAAEAAGQTTEAFSATTRSTKALADAFLPLDEMAAKARASFTALAEKWAPAAASLGVLTRDMAALTEAQARGIIVGEQYATIFSRISGAQREFAADQAALSQRLWNINTGVEGSPATSARNGGLPLGSMLPGGFPIETAQQSAAVFQEQFAMADAAQKVRNQIDPLGAAYARYNAQVGQLNTLLNTTNPLTKQAYLSETEHAQAVRQAADAHQGAVLAYMQSSAAVEEVTTKTKASTNEFFLNRQGTLELRASAVNAFQAIAAGMNPLFVAQMEGAQVLGAFGQGLKLSLREMLLWGAPIVAIVAGLALIVLRAKDTEDTLRLFNLQLDTIAKNTEGPTAAGLLALRNEMRDTGSAAADATKELVLLNQLPTRGISRAAGQQLLPLARDISVTTGGDEVAEFTKLTNAIAGGVDALTKYGFELGAISVPQATQMRQLAEHGRLNEALRIGIEAISATYKGDFEKSLTDLDKEFIKLKKGWNDVLETLAQTGVFEFLTNSLKDFANSFKATIAQIKDIYDFFKTNLDKDKGLLQDAGVLKTPSPTEFVVPGTDTAATGGFSVGQAQWAAGAASFPGRSDAAASAGIGGSMAAGAGAPTSLQETLAEAGAFPGLSNLAGAAPFPTQGTKSASAADAGLGASMNEVLAGQATLAATTRTQTNEVNKKFEADQRELAVMGLRGAAQKLATADLANWNEANQMGLRDGLRKTFLDTEHAKNLREIAIENKKAADAAAEDASGTLKSADAYQRSTVEGLKETAMVQARAQARTGVISVEQAYSQIIQKNAVDAIASGAQQSAALDPVIAGNARLAEAAANGTAAFHAAELQNDAIARSQDEVNRAELTGSQGLIDLAKSQEAALLVKIKDNEALKETISLRTATNSLKDQVEVVNLEASLQGKSQEEIRAATALLQAQQKIKNDMANVTDPKIKQEYLDQVVALNTANEARAEAARAEGRINDVVRSVADTIDNQLMSALDDAFSGKKAEDWGETMKKILRDLLKQIVEFTLIKPAIGSALGALGFGQAAQQFGSFGDLSKGIGKLFGLGGGGGPTDFLIPGTDTALQGGFSIGNPFSGESGGGGGGLFSGLSNLFGGGGGGPTDFLLPGTDTALQGGFSIANGLTEEAGGGLFSGLGSLFGGGGALSGIGSVLGSVAPFLGPIAGIGSLIGGLFGNKKPSNNASGADVDLATGGLSRVASGGVAQSDQAVQQITKQISDFTSNLQKLTGGTAYGTVGVQVGSRDGTKISYAGPGGPINATDLAAIELAITQNLSNVSDTLKTVLAHVTDPSQVQAAVAFAAAYDQLKTAADSAFSSISTDTKLIGPFETALNSIVKTFGELTIQANQFGLSLDPINAGLAEATKRLQGDFQKSLDQAINSANGAGGGDFINQLTTVSETFAANTRDAHAILTLDAPTSNKISQLEISQAQNILGGLSGDQLQKVVDAFGTSHPEIAAMAQDLLNMGGAANAAGVATQNAATRLQDLTAGIKSIGDLAQSLRTGPLAGLTPAQAVAAKNTEYQAALGVVQGAGTAVTGGQLSTLATAGQAAIEASRTAYGEGPQTAALRKSILGSLDSVSSVANAATAAVPGTTATATGTPVASGAVLLAQNAAVSAALHAAGVAGFAGGTHSTPSGWIVVGEDGPELMYQTGGASVVPINSHAAYQWRGPSFAGGTGSGGSLEQKLDALVGEVAALRKQTQGGQAQAAQDANASNSHLGSISNRLGPGIVAPIRRRFV